MKAELRVAGFGGQGVILAGHIIGKAAAIFDKKNATMIQSFGPEARGSSCSATVIIDDEQILYPYVTKPNIIVVMSQESYTKFGKDLADDSIMLYEESLVTVDKKDKVEKYGIPATKLAEDLGRKIVLNIVMVGFFAAMIDIVESDAVRKAVEASVPPGTEYLNLRAFDEGYNYGMKLREKQK